MSELSKQLVPLRQLQLHLGDGRSISCHACWNQARRGNHGRRQPFLPPELAAQAVREALPLGLRSVRLVGETVLLHPDLDPLLDRLESLELTVTIETDGAGLTLHRARRLARLPQSSIWVGLDGADAATHDAACGRAGSYEMATRAIHVLAEAGLPAQVVFTVRRSNAGQIPEVIRQVEEAGGDTLLFSILQPGPPCPLHPACIPSQVSIDPLVTDSPSGNLQVEELIALGWRVERELACTTRLHLLFGLPPVFRGLHPHSAVGGTGRLRGIWDRRCGILDGLSVLSGGEYALCGLAQVLPNLILGQAGQVPLELVWTGHPLLQVLRQGMPDRLEGVCRRCTVKSVCLGFCPGENYQRSGSFWSPNWFCETAERAGLFPAGRLVENYW